MRSRILVAVVVSALIAVGCSGDDGGAVTADDTDAVSTTTEPPSTSEPPTTEAPASTEAPAVLTASFRGVTETSIRVGVAVPDFDALQAAGIGNYQGDAEIAFQAFFDVINASGGIHGRQIDPFYVGFDFTRALTQDEACVRFTEDHEVFIVLYGLLGDSNLCLTEEHDTMVMTRSFQTSDLRDRSGETVWLQLNALDDERTAIMGAAIADSGRLDGRTIGILARGEDNDGLDGRVLEATLSDLGFESTVLLTEAPGDDPIARDSELEIIAQRFEVEGVDFLFDLWGGGNAAGIFAGAGFTPELAYKALGASVDGAEDRAVLDGAISVSEINEQAYFAEPDFQADCMDVVRAANPDLVEEMSYIPSGDEQAAGAPNWINPVMIACDQTMLLQTIGEIAGAELTNDSFRTALDELGPVDLRGYGRASFDSESKWDGLDEFYIQEYDFETDSIEVVGDAVVVDR